MISCKHKPLLLLVGIALAAIWPAVAATGKCSGKFGDRGPCRAYFKRYGYDDGAKACRLFVYGGCGGSSNKFVTKEECVKTCIDGSDGGEASTVTTTKSPVGKQLMGKPKQKAGTVVPNCDNIIDKGPCRAYFRRYAYDINKGACRAFVYGGCAGNGNNFLSAQSCKDLCEKTSQEKHLDNMVHDVHTPSKEPEEHPEEEDNEVEPTAKKLPKKISLRNYICTQPKDRGPCRGFLKSFAYDQEKNACVQFPWGGCGGNKNNFKSQTECELRCLVKDGDEPYPVTTAATTTIATTTTKVPLTEPEEGYRCTQPKNQDYCKQSFKRFHYDADSGKCINFIGCPASPYKTQISNNFEDISSCKQMCEENKDVELDSSVQRAFISTTTTMQTTTLSDVEQCNQPRERGNCRGFFRKFYYDSESNLCKTFVFGGCGGNSNRFSTMKECAERCVLDHVSTAAPTTTTTLKGPDYNEKQREFDHVAATNKTVCHLPSDRGNGRSFSVRFYWDDLEKRCRPFRYSGKAGNHNRFKTIDICETHCASLQNAEPMNIRCLYHHESGPCDASIKRWRWDNEAKQCKQLFWNNCMIDGITFNGEKNNFVTEDSCECHCQRPEQCESKCMLHEQFHYTFQGSDHPVEGHSYKAIVCRKLDSTIGDFFDMAKMHRHVEMIDLRNNQLNKDDMHVLRAILKNMPDLQVALLGGNQFYKELDDHFFHMNANLQYLDLADAGIQDFHKDTFDYLVGLRNLNLSGNAVESLSADQFHLLVDLEYLDLSHNAIASWKNKLLSSNRNLKLVDLTDNKLTELPKATFKYTPNLKVVKLDANPWTSLDGHLFHSNEYLSYLSITNTDTLKTLPKNIVQKNLQLEHVHLVNNTKMDSELAQQFNLSDGIRDFMKILARKGSASRG